MGTDTESPRTPTPQPRQWSLGHVQFSGMIALLVGVSQMLVGTVALDGLLTVVVAWGGGLLSAFGWNLIQERPVFYNGFSENGRPGWVSRLVFTLLTGTIVVAAGLILVG